MLANTVLAGAEAVTRFVGELECPIVVAENRPKGIARLAEYGATLRAIPPVDPRSTFAKVQPGALRPKAQSEQLLARLRHAAC
jgi:hypothetical protein